LPASIHEQIEAHQRVVADVARQADLIARIADRLLHCFANGGRLYLLGNGGSAADAQHIAAELVGRFKRNRRPLPALALTTDTSVLTALSNDLGYEHCFARQVEALVTAGDVLMALSVSGSSPNVLAALSSAHQKGATVIGLTGRRGEAMAAACDLCFVADHEASDRVQEAHQLVYHLVCDRIEGRIT